MSVVRLIIAALLVICILFVALSGAISNLLVKAASIVAALIGITVVLILERRSNADQDSRIFAITARRNFSMGGSLTYQYYGSETPTRERKLLVNLSIVVVLLCWWGMWNDFVPSEAWSTLGLAIAVIISISVLFIPFPGLKRGRLLISLLFSWIILVHGLPDVITWMIGAQTNERAVLWKDHSRARQICGYRLKGPPINRAFPDYLCVPSSTYSSFPRTVVVNLEGKVTYFGFHIAHVRYER